MTSTKASLIIFFFILLFSHCLSLQSFEPSKTYYSCPSSNQKAAPWGHLYLEGAVENIEFFSSTFSPAFPCETKEIVEASPLNACKVLDNAKDIKDKFVIALRGQCTFTEKINRIASEGAAGVIIVNTENDLFSFSDGNKTHEEGDVYNTIPSILVRRRAGMIMEQFLRHNRILKGRLVGEIQTAMFISSSIERCGACKGNPNYETKPKRVEGGHLAVSSSQQIMPNLFEFYASEFGAPLYLNKSVELLLAEPRNGCEPFTNIPEYGIQGKALLRDRGECPFTDKLQYAYEAGASMVIFVNTELTPITLPGSPADLLIPMQPAFKNGTVLPSLMIYSRAGETIRQMFQDSQYVSVKLSRSDFDITDAYELSMLYDIENWSNEADIRKEQYRNILPKVPTLTGERETEARLLYEVAESQSAFNTEL